MGYFMKKKDFKKIGTQNKKNGVISELEVAAHLLRKNYTVFKPFGEQVYDLVIVENNKIKKIQIKSGLYKNGCVVFRAMKRKYISNSVSYLQHYTKEEIDYFCVYSYELDRIFLISIEEVGERDDIYLRVDHPKNNQVKENLWAKDFEI